MGKITTFTRQQMIFKELFVGTLIYAVVLGFYDDYTSLVYAQSFSTVFLAAIILEVLTFLALLLKARILHILKTKQGSFFTFLKFFSVWFIMFISKFVFIWAIDFVLGDYMNIEGFIGILLLVVTTTFIHKLADVVFIKLGTSTR